MIGASDAFCDHVLRIFDPPQPAFRVGEIPRFGTVVQWTIIEMFLATILAYGATANSLLSWFGGLLLTTQERKVGTPWSISKIEATKATRN